MRPWLLLVIGLNTLALGLIVAQERTVSDKASKRPYRDGPLVAADFQAEPDKANAFTAWSEIDFDYRYEYSLRRRGEWIATLTKIEIHACLLTDKSWNKRPENATLMDHEQGHFDLAQTFALRAQCKLHSDLQTVDVLQGRHANKAAAIRDLEEKLKAFVQAQLEEAAAANKEYDKTTANGAKVTAQAEARREQKRLLDEAAAAWIKLSEK
jgi:hypothetical protein